VKPSYQEKKFDQSRQSFDKKGGSTFAKKKSVVVKPAEVTKFVENEKEENAVDLGDVIDKIYNPSKINTQSPSF
jgi:hypothetical protein